VILVLAGTSEGRKTALSLEKQGHTVIAATATAYGGELLKKEFRGEISSKPLDFEGMLGFIETKQVTRVIDATHPFAEQVSANARAACRRAGILYERLEREMTGVGQEEGLIVARDVEEAVQLAAAAEGNIFLTVGSSKIEQYASALDPDKLVVRILPVVSSLERCLSGGISPKNIIAMQGPFNEEINRALFRRYCAAMVITKDSGPAGGTAEKISAAKSLNIPIIIISRPLPS
jgi:precorrin-6A/cobalt-precorrin-6A reductase